MKPTRPTTRLRSQSLLADIVSAAASTQSPRLTTEGQSIVSWESEPFIVALKSGNADGAKGRRHSTVSHGTTCQTLSWMNT